MDNYVPPREGHTVQSFTPNAAKVAAAGDPFKSRSKLSRSRDDWVMEDLPSTPPVSHYSSGPGARQPSGSGAQYSSGSGVQRSSNSGAQQSSGSGSQQSSHSGQTRQWSPPEVQREETYSPSRGERLAKLKMRQFEKRANSAQPPVRALETSNLTPGGSHLSSPNSLLADFHKDYTHDSISSSPHYQHSHSPAENQNRARRNVGTFESPRQRTIDSPQYLRPGAIVRTKSSESLSSVSSVDSPIPPRKPMHHDHPPRNRIPQTKGPLMETASAPAYYDNHERPERQHSGRKRNAVSPSRDMFESPTKYAPNSIPPQYRSKSADTGARLANSLPPTSMSPLATNSNIRGGLATVVDRGAKPPGLDELGYAELTPVNDSPDKVLRQVIAKLQESNAANHKELDWLGQYDALNDGRRLVKHHPEVVRNSLAEFVKQASPAVEALRSYTSKNVMLLFSEMFATYGKGMDKVLDDLVPRLLKKAGELSTAGRENFMAIEADRVLSEMCHMVTDTKAITVLCASANHKGNYVRQKVAYHLDELMELQVGSSRSSLRSNNQCLERLFRTAAGFLDEGALETRTYGKRIIWSIKQCLGNRDDFERLLPLLKQDLQKKVIDVVEGSNGPPPPPAKGGGSRNRAGSSPAQLRGERGLQRTPSMNSINSAGDSRFKSTSAPSGGFGPNHNTPDKARGPRIRNDDAYSSPPSNNRAPSVPKRRPNSKMEATPSGALSTSSQETLDKAVVKLNAKDFRERMDALKLVEGVLGDVPLAPDSTVVGLLDGLIARLSDGNSKVNTQALEVLVRLFPHLRERIALSINTLVPALAANLGSSNDKIKAVANRAADQLINSVDPALLIQNFSHCVANSNLRGKPVLVEKLQAIIKGLYPTRPQLVVKYAVPAACALLNDAKGETKAASLELFATLANLMGESLMDFTASVNPMMAQKIYDMIVNSH